MERLCSPQNRSWLSFCRARFAKRANGPRPGASWVPGGQLSFCANCPALSLPSPSRPTSGLQQFPSPLLQGEIGHHPFSPLGTRNPCVSFPVKGLPSPEVTQKPMVWLPPVTASTGRACVCVCEHVCMCMHTHVRAGACARVCMYMCVHTCVHACPMPQLPRPHPGLRETYVLTRAVPRTH